MLAPFTTTAQAQSVNRGGGPAGLTIGAEAGAIEHHVYIAEFAPDGARTDGDYYRSWGAGAGIFVGYDVPLGGRMFIGGELAGVIGGNDVEASFPDGASYRASPRYGWRVKGRVGYNVTRNLAGYATAGYGGHTYRIEARLIDGAETSGSSFLVGGGIIYQLSDRVAVRLDGHHLDNQSNQIFIGIPVRF